MSSASISRPVEIIFNIEKVPAGYRSDNTFSSGISSDFSDSEFESIENDILKFYEPESKIYTGIESQILKEFQSRKAQNIEKTESTPGMSFIAHNKPKASEFEKLNDPVYLRHKQKQTIMQNAKLYVEKLVENRVNNMRDHSIDSFSEDSMDELDAKNDSNNVDLYIKSGKLSLPKPLIEFGVENIFNNESLNKFKSQLSEDDKLRLADKLPKGVNLESAMNELSSLASQKLRGIPKSEHNLVHKNPFLSLEHLLISGRLSKEDTKIAKYEN